MTREEFKDIARQAVEAVTSAAEERLSRPLPRRYVLQWLGVRSSILEDDVAESLTAKVFLAEDEIIPCIDIFLNELLPNDRLLLVCYRASYQPCRYGEHWLYQVGGHDAGQVGPFQLGCGSIVESLIEKRL